MSYRGRVKNGRIVLEPPVELPEGIAVTIETEPPDVAAMLEHRRTDRICIDPQLAKEIAQGAEFLPEES